MAAAERELRAELQIVREHRDDLLARLAAQASAPDQLLADNHPSPAEADPSSLATSEADPADLLRF